MNIHVDRPDIKCGSVEMLRDQHEQLQVWKWRLIRTTCSGSSGHSWAI